MDNPKRFFRGGRGRGGGGRPFNSAEKNNNGKGGSARNAAGDAFSGQRGRGVFKRRRGGKRLQERLIGKKWVKFTTPEVREDINILLLGETGVGKSTFINSFINYVTYQTFNKALNSDAFHVIPSKFTFYKDEDPIEVCVGEDRNEAIGVGDSATQCAKAYSFPLPGGETLRIIDTPGIGDTRGLEQDKANMESILDFLGKYKQLHAICLLLKPNTSRLTIPFEFCIKQLLCKLEKSAADNVAVIFTNARSTFYGPGETSTILKKLFDDISKDPPYTKIPFEKKNTFYMDNEAYRYLIACKNDVSFTGEERKHFSKSWDRSVDECKRLINYIGGKDMKPHEVQGTLSVNNCRRVILLLTKPLADISQLIQDNKEVLENHRRKIDAAKRQKEDLKGELYLPCVSLKEIPLTDPATVCTNNTCCDVVMVESKSMREYRQICHNPCSLKNVPKDLIGAKELVECDAFDKGTQKCTVCSCDFKSHTHVYYLTERVESRIEDNIVTSQLDENVNETQRYENYIKMVEQTLKEYNEEHKIITKNLAAFTVFLKENSLISFNDAYKGYIKYLIEREESLGSEMDDELIKRYNQMMAEYEEEKSLLTNQEKTIAAQSITASSIEKCVKSLFTLKHTGSKLKSLYEIQNSGVSKQHFTNEEYQHKLTGVLPFFRDTEPRLCSTDVVKELKLPLDLMKLAVGKKGNNLNAARAIKDVIYINTVAPDTIKVIGKTRDAVNSAISLLNFEEITVQVPVKYSEKFSREKSFYEKILSESGVKSIRIISGDDQTYKGWRKKEFTPFVILGRKSNVTTAKELILNAVATWETEAAQQLKKPSKFQAKIKLHHSIAYILEDEATTETLLRAYQLDGIDAINLDPESGEVEIVSLVEESFKMAKDLFDFVTCTVLLPRQFVVEDVKINDGKALKAIKKSSGVIGIKVPQPDHDLVPVEITGTRKSVHLAKEKFEQLLKCSKDSLKYAIW